MIDSKSPSTPSTPSTPFECPEREARVPGSTEAARGVLCRLQIPRRVLETHRQPPSRRRGRCTSTPASFVGPYECEAEMDARVQLRIFACSREGCSSIESVGDFLGGSTESRSRTSCGSHRFLTQMLRVEDLGRPSRRVRETSRLVDSHDRHASRASQRRRPKRVNFSA